MASELNWKLRPQSNGESWMIVATSKFGTDQDGEDVFYQITESDGVWTANINWYVLTSGTLKECILFCELHDSH